METYFEKVKRLNTTYIYKDIEVDGAKYHYLIAGESDSEVIVLLNGGMNSHEMWVDFIEHLSHKYRVINFDYPTELKTIRDVAAGIIRFLDELGVTECYLTGASFGGYMAQAIAREKPDMVKGMFLHATGAMDEDTIKDFRRKYFFAPLLLLYMKHCNYDKRFKPLIIKSMDKYTVSENSEVQKYIHDMAVMIADGYTREKDLHITSLLVDIMHQEPVTSKEFSSIRPVVMILPSNDFFTSKQQENLKSVFPQAQVVRIEGGHMSTITRAGEFADLIDKTINNAKKQ